MRPGAKRSRRSRKHRHIDNCHGAEAEDALVLLTDSAAATVPPWRRTGGRQSRGEVGTMFGVSSLGTVSVEEIGSTISTPKLFQLYFHKDRGLTGSMIERCIAADFDVLALTVDTITGGNRERDLRTGFTSPPRLTLKSLLSL